MPQFPGKYFPGNWTTASLLAGYTANYTAGCQSFSLPHSSGDIRGSSRPKRSSLDTDSRRHKASLCAGILCSCRLSHGKPVSYGRPFVSKFEMRNIHSICTKFIRDWHFHSLVLRLISQAFIACKVWEISLGTRLAFSFKMRKIHSRLAFSFEMREIHSRLAFSFVGVWRSLTILYPRAVVGMIHTGDESESMKCQSRIKTPIPNGNHQCRI